MKFILLFITITILSSCRFYPNQEIQVPKEERIFGVDSSVYDVDVDYINNKK
jgi:hypothetical protein